MPVFEPRIYHAHPGRVGCPDEKRFALHNGRGVASSGTAWNIVAY